MINQDEFTFWIIPDLADVPHRTYLIYKKNDRSKAIGIVIFNEDGFDTKTIPDLLLSEELALFDSIQAFYKSRYPKGSGNFTDDL